uniref:Uncharacterized protein n=1 Tax=Enterococcus phage Porthos TaxID=2795670 RepID=A0A8D6XUH7_9CAUD
MTNTTNKPKYLVVDNYDLDMYELGRVNTMREVKKLCKEQVEATEDIRERERHKREGREGLAKN